MCHVVPAEENLANKYLGRNPSGLRYTVQPRVKVSLHCLSRNVTWQSDCKKKTMSAVVAAQRSCGDLIRLDSKLIHGKTSYSVKKKHIVLTKMTIGTLQLECCVLVFNYQMNIAYFFFMCPQQELMWMRVQSKPILPSPPSRPPPSPTEAN